MKKELKYFLFAHLLIILFLVYQTFDLITLLYDDSFKDAILASEINSPLIDKKQQLIPKILHQTYKTSEIPEIWKEGQQRCIDLHPDYEYILWTDELSEKFISQEYPWFLETFQNYKYPIERADAIRYFVLNHFGGIYIDLDDGCNRNLDPLLTYPAFVRKTIPTGISNDVMGAVPRHPFFIKVIESLQKYDHNWLVPYITIMYSTGPLFLSVIWKQYKRFGVAKFGEVRILEPLEYKAGDNPFFKISKGSSWHMDDAKFLFLLAHHIVLAVIGGFLIALTFIYCEYRLYTFLCSKNSRYFFKGLINLIRFKKFNFENDYDDLDDDYDYNEYIKNNNTKENVNNNSTSKLNLGNNEEKSISKNALNSLSLPKSYIKFIENKRKKNKSSKTRIRKDSNLPLAINIDLEKNVSSIEE